MGVDGKTAYERLSGRPCAAQVAEFGERIWYIPLTRAGFQGNGENMSPGYYLGPVEGRNGACVATREGILHARTIKRTPWEERWSAEILEVVDAIPMVPPGQHRAGARVRGAIPVEPLAVDGSAEDAAPNEPRTRRAMLLRSDFETHGWTQGCNLCWRMQNGRGIGGAHSEARRTRMEEEPRRSDRGRARIQRAAERFAHDADGVFYCRMALLLTSDTRTWPWTSQSMPMCRNHALNHHVKLETQKRRRCRQTRLQKCREIRGSKFYDLILQMTTTTNHLWQRSLASTSWLTRISRRRMGRRSLPVSDNVAKNLQAVLALAGRRLGS